MFTSLEVTKSGILLQLKAQMVLLETNQFKTIMEKIVL